MGRKSHPTSQSKIKASKKVAWTQESNRFLLVESLQAQIERDLIPNPDSLFV
jgi:hypothetical protein